MSVRRVRVAKARASADDATPDLLIQATEPMATLSTDAEDRAHEIAARQIVSALRATLPAGTVRRILVLLLEREHDELTNRGAHLPGEPGVPPTQVRTAQELRALAVTLRQRLDIVDEAATLLDELVYPSPLAPLVSPPEPDREG